MQIGELAGRAGISVKAVRYYESLGLLTPERLSNGYRDYDDRQLRAAIEIRELTALGLRAREVIPFVECLALGHEHSDDCVASLASYRDSIREIDRLISSLQDRRARLVDRLHEGAARTFAKEMPMDAHDYTSLPENLPVPSDDGAVDHLWGATIPGITLPTSDGGTVDLGVLGDGRTVVYIYPLTGRPGTDLPDGWDNIPGARGCTTEACDFRDHHTDLLAAGATRVWGLSSQEVAYQAELVERLRLPFKMISDQDFRLADVLDLPSFSAEGHSRLYKRMTLIIREGRVEHIFYPVFPPNTHAQQVLDWMKANPTF